MIVDSTRVLETATGEPARTRAETKNGGFPALMDSILGGSSADASTKAPGERPAASRERGSDEAASERGARGDQGEDAERAPRGPGAREAREPRGTRDARNDREVRRGRGADRQEATAEDEGDSSVDGREAATSTGADGSEGGDAPAPKGAAAEMDPSQVVPIGELPAWEVAAALALPELLARLAIPVGDPAVAAEGEGEGESDQELDAAAALGAAVSGDVDEAVAAGDATIPDAPIVEPAARDVAVGVVESAARRDEIEADAAVATTTDDAMPERVRVETERLVERTSDGDARSAAAVEASRRDPLEAPAVASGAVGSRAGVEAREGDGSGDPSQQRPDRDATSDGDGARRSGVEANATLGAAAAVVTTAAGESAAKAAEANAAVGPDAAVAPAAEAAAQETDAAALPERIPVGRAAEAITVQADWLATRGGGSARLVLNPPELGEIVIRVSVRQQNVDVVMVAQTALGHSMAQDQSDRLAQAFAHRDLRLDQFEVRRADPSDAASTGQFGSSDAGQRERERADAREAGFDFAAGRVGRRRTGGAGEGPSAAPRPGGGERASGIDLRI